MDFNFVSPDSLGQPLRLRRLRFAPVVVLLVFGAGIRADLEATRNRPMLERLEMLEAEYLTENPGEFRPLDLSATIAAILETLEANGAPPSGASAVQALNQLIFEDLAIQSSSDLKDPGNLFVSRVLERRQGYCVGIAALYLVLAERFDLPIFAVDTPNHLFLRYDDGVTRINIESMDKGATRDDAAYIRAQNIPEASMRRGVFMRALTTDEFIARFRSNLGVIHSERKNYVKAAREYRTAIDLDALLPAAYYNLANDLMRQGEWRASVRLFSKSLSLYATDVWALNNRGLAYVRMGKIEKARRDFEEALRIDPEFEQAIRNLQSIR